MKKIINNIVTIIILSMVLTTTIFASSKNKLDKLEQEKKNSESEIESSKGEVKTIEDNIKQTVSRIYELRNQIEDYEKRIKQLENDLSNKETEIDTTLAELEEAKEKENTYFEQTRERIKVMYEYGNSAYLDVIVEAKNLSDFFNRVEYINAVLEYDTKILENLEGIREDIVEKEVKLEVEKEELLELKENCNLQKEAKKEIQMAEEKEMNDLEENKEEVLARIKELEDEQKEIEKAIDRIKSSLTYDGGKMDWPFDNNFTVTSPFGMRYHPILKRNALHTGIDIRAGTGTSVKAAYNGIVVFAGYQKAWGHYILLDHGSGYVSIYAHNSKLLVKQGQKVTIGQTIAKSGNSGWSTGPHLHFGIRKDGDWLNPIKILQK